MQPPDAINKETVYKITRPCLQKFLERLAERYLNSEVLILISILIMAGVLRWNFSPGIGRFDEILYANSARTLTLGTLTLTPFEGAGRVGIYAPLALFYYFLGPSISATMAWPFLCSLITTLVLYKIVKLLANTNAAILATFFWALFPLSIGTATSNYPDTIMAMVNAAAVYMWLVAQKNRGVRAAIYYFLCIVFLVWGVWTKQQIVITAGFLLLWSFAKLLPPVKLSLLKKGIQKPSFLLFGFLSLTLLMFLYGNVQRVSFPDALAVTSQDVFGQLSTQPFFYLMFPFLVVVLITSVTSKKSEDSFAGAWFIFTFLALEWMPMSFNPTTYTPGAIRPLPDRALLFLMLPFAVMAGQILERLANTKALSKTVFFVATSMIAIVFLIRAELVDMNLVLGISSLAILFLAILSLSLPFAQSSALSRHYIALFFIILGVSIINPLQKHVEYAYWDAAYFRNLEQTAELVSSEPTLPLYFYAGEDPRSLNHLNFASGYQLAPNPFNEFSGRMRFFSTPSDITENAFVIVIDSAFLDKVSVAWQEIAHFTQPPTVYFANPPRIRIFLVSGEGGALEQKPLSLKSPTVSHPSLSESWP